MKGQHHDQHGEPFLVAPHVGAATNQGQTHSSVNFSSLHPMDLLSTVPDRSQQGIEFFGRFDFWATCTESARKPSQTLNWLSSLCFNRVVGTQEKKANMVRDITSLGSGSKARPRSSLTINSAKTWMSSALIYPKLKSRLWSQKAKLGLEDLSIRRLGICSGSI